MHSADILFLDLDHTDVPAMFIGTKEITNDKNAFNKYLWSNISRSRFQLQRDEIYHSNIYGTTEVSKGTRDKYL